MARILVIDLWIRRWGAIAVFAIFTFGVSLTWVTSGHAQTPIENSIRLAIQESKWKDQTDMNRSVEAGVAVLNTRIAVEEAAIVVNSKRLDSFDAIGRWLVMGVFGLLGLKMWERIIPPNSNLRSSQLRTRLSDDKKDKVD